MAKAGLTFESSLYQDIGGSPVAPVNPYTGLNAAASTGADALRRGLADIAIAGEQARGALQSQFTMPTMRPPARTEPDTYFNPATRQLYINGIIVDEQDEAGIVNAARAVGQGQAGAPQGEGWQALPGNVLPSIVQGIEDPTMGRLISRNIGRGVDVMQMLGGQALRFAGAEELGRGIVEQQEADLARTAPYERTFTEIENADDLGDWFVANFAQQVPNILESIAAAGAGAAAGAALGTAAGPVGTAVGGALGGIGGFIGKLLAKQGVKNAVTKAAAKKAAGQVLDTAERKLLNKVGGAAAATFASSYGMGIGDIYGEQIEGGAPDRVKAALSAIPYATLESVGDLFLGSRVLAPTARTRRTLVTPDGETTITTGTGLLGRVGRGVAAGGAVEGTTEALQEVINIANNPSVDFDSPEAINRLINSFAAGAAIGGPLAGAGAVRSPVEDLGRMELLPPPPPRVDTEQQDANLLNPQQSAALPTPTTQEERAASAVEATGLGPREPGMAPGQRLLMGGAAPGQFGPQGVLDLGPQPVADVARLSRRPTPVLPEARRQELGLPSPPLPEALIPFQPEISERQVPLDFAPPAPGGVRFTEEQQVANPVLQRRLAAELAEQQRQAQLQAQRDADYTRALRQREMQIAQQGQPPAVGVVPSPRVQGAPQTAAEQLRLFGRRAMPTPSRAQAEAAARLRRGTVPPAAPAAAQQQLGLQREAQQLGLPYIGQPVTTEQAQETWNDQRPRNVRKWDNLSEERQAQWADAIANGRATPALRKEISRQESAGRLRPRPAEEPTDAVQEPSSAPVPTRAAPEDREAVGEGVPGEGAAPRAEEQAEVKKPQAAAPVAAEERPAEPEAEVAAEPEPAPEPEVVEEPAPEPVAEAVEPRSPQESWDEEVEPGDVKYADLPQAAKDEWADSDFSGAAMIVIMDRIDEGDIKMTVAETFNYYLAVADAALDANNIDRFNEALPTLVETAYFTNESPNTIERINEAREYLADVDNFNAAQQNAIVDQIVEQMPQRIDARYTRGANKGAAKPWYTFLQAMPGALQRVTNKGTVFSGLTQEEAQSLLDRGMIYETNLPASTLKALGKEQTATQEADANPQRSPAVKLAALIRDTNGRTTSVSPSTQADIKRNLADLWDEVQEKDIDTTEQDALLGNPLSAYFDEDGQPITNTISGRLRIATKKLTQEQLSEAEATRRADAQAQKEADELGDIPTLEDYDEYADRDTDEPTSWLRAMEEGDGRFARAEGRTFNKPMAKGRVQFMVRAFLNKLAIKPRVYVYRNQDELRTQNRKLYDRAAAARPQGDFATIPAKGYSFGKNEIILFTDRLLTEDDVNFVLAHETNGHIGLRALIPAKQFDRLMESIYDADDSIRDAVDASMEVRGMGKAEAVEEYLADFAADLDVSLINRIWNAIKGALNKLGVKFGDEVSRYWVNQARRYVRNGEVSHPFTIGGDMGMAFAIETGQDPENVGRFSQPHTLRSANLAAGLMVDNVGGNLTSIEEAARTIRDSVGDARDAADKFLASAFSLLNYRVRENPGFSALERVLNEGRGIAMKVKNSLNETMRPLLARAVKVPFSDIEVGGITEAQRETVHKMLYDAQRRASSRITRLSQLGKTPLYTLDEATGSLIPNQPEIDRLVAQGRITLEEARNGYSYEAKFEQDGRTVTETVQVPGIPGLTEDSIEWKAYVAARDAMQAVELEMLKARYVANIQERDLVFREIGNMTNTRELASGEKQFFDRMYRTYRDLWLADQTTDENGDPALNPESIEKANEFIEALNAAIIGRGTDRNEALRAYFDGAAFDDVVASIEAFKDRFALSDDTRFVVQNQMKKLVVDEISNSDADLYTKRSLASGYTPLIREGAFQVRVMAKDKNGNDVLLKDSYKEQLVYSQFERESEAKRFAELTNEAFTDDNGNTRTFKVEAYDSKTREYVQTEVTLQAVPEAALDSISVPPELNLNDFVRGLRRFDINLAPKKLEQVVVAMTRQNNRARNRLQRAFVPGASTDASKAISQHIEARASSIAKILMRPRISELTNLNMRSTQRLWNGDAEKLAALKAEYEATRDDPQATDEAKMYAKREYDRYAYMYERTNPTGEASRANQYFNEATRVLGFLESNQDIVESDFGAGRVASSIRAWTSMAQLGGSIATGALNYLGAVTNGIPYLATYNDKTAFGGGFGFGKSVSQFMTALNQVGLLKAIGGRLNGVDMNTAAFYDAVAADPELQKQYNLSEREARFLALEIREGEMIPALTNAMVGSARGRVTSGAAQKAIDGWMWTFNSTEQATRRALGLSAYRMSFDRAKAAGLSDADANAKARDFAVSALRYTVGDYSVINRPPIWRSGIQSFIYMYKVFPTTTIQLLKRLPRQGQIYMLASLFVLGGMTAFPFAEDIEDLLDSIAQALGFGTASVRFEIAKAIDSVAPGLSPFAMRGFANAYLGLNLADRISAGNFIPGTGIFLAGADVGRELTDIMGPAASFLTGAATAFPQAIRAVATERVDFVDVFRESPITMLRAFGDMYAYTQAGAIVDKRGYVVSPDLSAYTMVGRVLGFYPAAASEQYDVIRVSRRIVDYQREVTSGFRTAWIKANIERDREKQRAIEDAVRQWNEVNRGTALEIRNFRQNSVRALREAQRPAGERFLRTTPRAARDEVATVAELLGY